MKRIDGYISRNTIKDWLENYESLQARDKPIDMVPGNSGPKPADGVTASQLNLVMLNQAISNLPMLTKACCKARWVYRLQLTKTLEVLDVSKKVYYDRCEQAIDLIYKELNGEKVGYMTLFDKISNSS